MDLRDAYRVLELAVGANEAAVRDARKTLAKVWHPDRHANDPELQKRAQIKLAEVNEAFALVRAAGFPASAPAAAPKPAAPPAPPRAAEPRSELDFVPPRRVRWSVIFLVVAAVGVGTYFAIVKLGGKSEAKLGQPDPVPDRPSTTDATVVVTSPEPADAAEAPGGTFGLGATRDEVRAAQGAPRQIDKVIDEDWRYGRSEVTFDPRTGTVIGWSQRDTRLNVKLEPRDAAVAAKARAAGGFTRGSTKDEVIAVQGTPTAIDTVVHETWRYDHSRIDFDQAGQVTDWNDFDDNLHIRE